MIILGISAFYHDSAAAIIRNGEILAAAQEERFTRRKHDAAFPENAITYCLKAAGVTAREIDRVAFYEKPFLKFDRLLETYLSFAPKGFTSFCKAMPIWMNEKLFQKDLIINELSLIGAELGNPDKLLFSEHHLSHAASAFYPSPFNRAAVLTMDGVGEWATTTLCIGIDNNLSVMKEILFPHSVGLLYSAFTYYLGFKVNSGEYKVMGLAPYGEPKYYNLIMDNLIDVKSDGSFNLNIVYFEFCTGMRMVGKKFEKLFDFPIRNPEESLQQFHMDVAASIQKVTEEIIIRISRNISNETGEKNLCLAGGVALNCVANGKLLRSKYFDKIFIQPASGDAGGALGAALAAYHLHEGRARSFQGSGDSMKGSFLGPSFDNDEIIYRLNNMGANFEVVNDQMLIEETASALASQQAVGWRQGRLEYGPRSLGCSSILADPRSPTMQKDLNMKVKFRESFRPFAPAILSEKVADWFDISCDSPYMLLVAEISSKYKKEMTEEELSLFGIDKLNINRSDIPSVTHVDYSARIQTVHEDTNPLFHKLIKTFENKTGCPVLVNTSFNVRGEPIVMTPEDAFKCFMGTGLDFLAVGNCIMKKIDQNPNLKIDYKNSFELD